jgi:hypothetical protein
MSQCHGKLPCLATSKTRQRQYHVRAIQSIQNVENFEKHVESKCIQNAVDALKKPETLPNCRLRLA